MSNEIAEAQDLPMSPEGLMLKKLCDYGYYMYCTSMGVERFNQESSVAFKGKEIQIKMQDNGRYLINILNTDISADVDVAYVTVSPQADTMLNMSPRYHILNLEEIPEEYHEYIDEAAVFAVSMAQRSIALPFFAGISEKSLDYLEMELCGMELQPAGAPSEE
tara:strand:+ start:365 stop:853 length:489 start_codon:yes stop_codon:yes gene_type:complete